MPRSDFHHLDCTFRDGGYQAGWKFKDTTLKRCLDLAGAMQLYGVELGNLGLKGAKRLDRGSFRDLPWALTADQRAILRAATGVPVGVMVDAREVIDLDRPVAIPEVRAGLDAFPVPVSFLRLAAPSMSSRRRSRIAGAVMAATGVHVFVNLMKIGALGPVLVEETARRALAACHLAGL